MRLHFGIFRDSTVRVRNPRLNEAQEFSIPTTTAIAGLYDCNSMQAAILDGVLEALRIGVGFLWTAAWAIIMGLTVTSLV